MYLRLGTPILEELTLIHNKRSNGKRSIFLVVSFATKSSWICPKQTRIHGCHLHKIWMEGEGHIRRLCLWRDKFCGSQPHM